VAIALNSSAKAYGYSMAEATAGALSLSLAGGSSFQSKTGGLYLKGIAVGDSKYDGSAQGASVDLSLSGKSIAYSAYGNLGIKTVGYGYGKTSADAQSGPVTISLTGGSRALLANGKAYASMESKAVSPYGAAMATSGALAVSLSGESIFGAYYGTYFYGTALASGVNATAESQATTVSLDNSVIKGVYNDALNLKRGAFAKSYDGSASARGGNVTVTLTNESGIGTLSGDDALQVNTSGYSTVNGGLRFSW
jgi:hypothetical protein